MKDMGPSTEPCGSPIPIINLFTLLVLHKILSDDFINHN